MRLRKRLSLSLPSTPTPCCEASAPASCGCSSQPAAVPNLDTPGRIGWVLVPLGVALYLVLEPLSRWITTSLFGLSLESRWGAAVAFFLYDAPKMLLLMAAATFVVTFLQSFLDPHRTRRFLARQRGAVGNVLASLLGVVTPFCSCSAVPLFIGLVRAGVPLGVTFSYLVSAPMVNEVALLLLLALFGWKIAALYAGTGIALAVLSGWVMGQLRPETDLEPWVLSERQQVQAPISGSLSLVQRLDQAMEGARGTVRQIWPYALLGIAVGALIHGYLPDGLLARFMGRQVWWAVPAAVAIGVPLYAGTAVVLPLVQTLLAKGAALGTTLAFMMAVTALSLPEMILLRRVLSLRLLLLFVGVVTLGILAVGFLFNLLV